MQRLCIACKESRLLCEEIRDVFATKCNIAAEKAYGFLAVSLVFI